LAEEINQSVGEDLSGSDDGESGVMKALRKQIRDLEGELKSRPSRDSLEAELRSQLEREKAAASQLVEKGHPAGLAELMLQKIDSDADITEEVVDGFLKGLGYESQAPQSESKSEPSEQERQLAEVTQLSRQVSVAATGEQTDDVMKRIGEAKSVSELAAIAAQGGFAQ
jgi:hypothetical protein